MTPEELPVAVVGAGPIGLVTALGLVHYGVPVLLFEEDDQLSLDTKAGTVLTRTLEVLHRYGAVDDVLSASLRIDEIGELDRATNIPTLSVRTGDLTEDTRFPFVVNIPQHEFEPVVRTVLEQKAPGVLHMGHRLADFTQTDDHVELRFATPTGDRTVLARYLLSCDGGRSQVRESLGIPVSGRTLQERYMLVDLRVDLDVDNPRDYPYLAYFGDPDEWMILVRQPHCWRFLYPLAPGRPEPTRGELADKAQRFIGNVSGLEVIGSNVYTVHHRVADRWHDGRVFLMGDAAHLITPMWALGLNTGVLDASNLPWRLAWVHRGWADRSLLDGYEKEQAPVAIKGSGQMAEAARAYMGHRDGAVTAMTDGNWGNAFTRALLGVRLDVDGTGDWSMIQTGDRPTPVAPGDRAPDLPLFSDRGRVYVHDLVADSFVALYFTDTRRRPRIAAQNSPALRRFIVSRWDAPHDSGLRDRALFDPGERVRNRFGVKENTLVLLRPDAHVAAIVPYDPTSTADPAADIYHSITGRPFPHDIADARRSHPMTTATAPDGTTITLGDVGQEIVFENDQVRVWEITLQPGQRQPWHQHHNPYIVIALEAGDNRIDALAGGEPRLVHEPRGGVVYREPGEIHMLTNRGTTQYRSRLIELKSLGENARQEHTHG